MLKKIKLIFLNGLLVAASILVVLIAIEGGARVYLYLSPLANFHSHIEFRKSIPPPYENSSYNVPEFVSESFSLPGWNTPSGTRLLIPLDFSGKYINIKNGIRVTAGQPLSFKNTIYFFGGSTVFCNEVPDEHTLPSALQKIINKYYPNKFVVKNYGASSVVASQELERLQTLKINRGDLIIFFDGANDAYNSIYRAEPKGWIMGENKQIILDKGKAFEFILKIHTKYGKYSKFIDHFLSPFDYAYEPEHLKDSVKTSALAIELDQVYRKSVVGAKNYAEKYQAKFYHFLQPTLFHNSKSILYKYQLASNPYLVAKGIDKAMIQGFVVLSSAVEKMQKMDGVVSFDLSRLSESSPLDSVHYIDWVHVANEGNQILGEEIFKRLDTAEAFR